MKGNNHLIVYISVESKCYGNYKKKNFHLSALFDQNPRRFEPKLRKTALLSAVIKAEPYAGKL